MIFWNKLKIILFNNRDLSTLGTANLLNTSLLGLFWFFIATIIQPDDYGQISYYISIAAIITTITTPGVSNTLVVFTSRDFKIKSPLFFMSIVLILISSIILFFIIGNFATSLYLIGYAAFGLVISELLGSKLYGEYFKITLTQRILSIILPISLYYILGIDGIILGLAFSYIAFIYKFIIMLRHGKIDFSVLKTHKQFMLDTYGYDISRILTTQLDKLIIFPLFGLITLGNYYLAVQFLAIGTIIPGTVYQYLLSQESKNKSFNNLKIIAILTSVFITTFTIILAPILLPIIFPHFVDVVPMVQIIILSLIPQTINLMYITKFLTNNNSRPVLIGSGIFIIIQICGIVFLGNTMGVIGIALALLLGHLSEFIFFSLHNQYGKNKQ